MEYLVFLDHSFSSTTEQDLGTEKVYSIYFRDGYNIQTCFNGNGWTRKLLDKF